MDPRTQTAEGKIIEATIECIERYGLKGATNRRIAALAGVNIAAINYYFRSKETLIQRCMQVTLENAFDWEEFSRLPGASPQERCTAIFENLLEGGCNFPGITRAHFYELLVEGKYDTLAVKKLNEFVDHLVTNLKELGSPLDENELRMALVQISSAVILMILVPRLFQSRLGIDMCDEADRKQFVRRLVERLLSREKSPS